MAIARLKPEVDPPVIPSVPTVEKKDYLGIVADLNDTQIDSLVAYIGGMPWVVDYYGQLIGQHNDLRELDVQQDAAFQQYQKIRQLELRVDGALSASYDEEKGLTTVTGSATAIFIAPNENDYFVAEAGSRKQGLFRVTSVARKTFDRDSVYTITYSLVHYVDETDPDYLNLAAKVVRTYHFCKDRLTEHQAPILTDETYALAKNLGQAYRDLAKDYMAKFFNRTHMTLVVPGQDDAVYDYWLVAFLQQIVDVAEAPEFRQMTITSLDHERYVAQGNLWTALLERSWRKLLTLPKKALLANRGAFAVSSWLKGAVFSKIDFYVYPKDPSTETRLTTDPMPYDRELKTLMPDGLMETPAYAQVNTYLHQGVNLPVIKSVGLSDYYVLSEAFYDGGSELSVLEILTRDYLKGATLDATLLSVLVDRYDRWPALEQFYYGPILLLLIKNAIREYYA